MVNSADISLSSIQVFGATPALLNISWIACHVDEIVVAFLFVMPSPLLNMHRNGMLPLHIRYQSLTCM